MLARMFPSFAGNIRSRDVFRPIARERKSLMDYKLGYLFLNILCSSKFTVVLKLRSRKTIRVSEDAIFRGYFFMYTLISKAMKTLELHYTIGNRAYSWSSEEGYRWNMLKTLMASYLKKICSDKFWSNFILGTIFPFVLVHGKIW